MPRIASMVSPLKSAMQNFYMLKSDSLRNDVLISYATIVSVLVIGPRQVCDDHHPKTFLKIARLH